MIKRPGDVIRTTMEGGLGEYVPYSNCCPEEYYRYLEKKLGKNPNEVYHLDLGIRHIGPKIVGKPPWDQPWGDQPDNPEEERILFERFRKYLPGMNEVGMRVTEWGCMTIPSHYHHLRKLFYPMEYMGKISELEDYPFPDFTSEWRWEGVADQVVKYKEEGYYIFGQVGSLYETSWFMRGQEQLLIDLYENPEFAERLLDTVTQKNMYNAQRLAGMGVDCISCGDDVGMQHGLIMSKPMLNKWILSRWEKVIDAAKLINPRIRVNFHTDGKMSDAIPDLLAIGVNCINPVQPECDDPETIKKEYKNKLVLIGTFSALTLTFGTPDEVKDEARKRMDVAKKFGGMVITNNNTPDVNTPWANFDAFFEACEENCRV